MISKLCLIRNVYLSVNKFEGLFEKEHGIGLNEAMVLCSLFDGKLSSGELANLLGLTNSNTSKVIRSVEKKGLINRVMGKKDKRQMYFSLTAKGKDRLESIKCKTVSVPDLLTQFISESED